MKTKIQKSIERGITRLNWLDSWHSFSFGDYFNKSKMDFGALKVLNEDIIQPGQGFGLHPHNNMEIITIVLEGSLTHEDSMGNKEITPQGDIQKMSAGSGIEHSEYNNSDKKVHLLQIWISPKKLNITPNYEQKTISKKFNELIILVSNEKASIKINQDASLLIANFNENKEINYTLKNNKNGVYIFLIKGKMQISNNNLSKGDSIEIKETNNVNFKAEKNTSLILIEVPI